MVELADERALVAFRREEVVELPGPVRPIVHRRPQDLATDNVEGPADPLDGAHGAMALGELLVERRGASGDRVGECDDAAHELDREWVEHGRSLGVLLSGGALETGGRGAREGKE